MPWVRLMWRIRMEETAMRATVQRFNAAPGRVVGYCRLLGGSCRVAPLSPLMMPPGLLTYRDQVEKAAISVRRFNGSTWEVVGTAGFSAVTPILSSLPQLMP